MIYMLAIFSAVVTLLRDVAEWNVARPKPAQPRDARGRFVKATV